MVTGGAERQVRLQHGGKGLDEGWHLLNVIFFFTVSP